MWAPHGAAAADFRIGRREHVRIHAPQHQPATELQCKHHWVNPPRRADYTIKATLDSIIYCLATGLTFAYFWPK